MNPDYEQGGIVQALVGMRYARDYLDELIREAEKRLEELRRAEGAGPALSRSAKRRGRPPKAAAKAPPSKYNSWAGKSPAEIARLKRNLSVQAKARMAKLKANGQAALVSGWSADPEERKLEMARRMAKWSPQAKTRHAAAARKNQASQTAAHWAAKSPAQSAWDNMSARQKKERLAKMRAGFARAAAAKAAAKAEA